MDLKQKALEIDYKLFHKDHFYPEHSSQEVIEKELDRLVQVISPLRDKSGRFRKRAWYDDYREANL